jgi:hypothetical protein
LCYSFTTPDIPDYFTEQFTGDNDLDNQSVLLTPNGTYDFYAACAESITALPTDPTGGTVLSLSDDDFQLVTVGDGKRVSLYGTEYTSYYIGSNGYITFTAGDDDYDDTLAEHFGPLPRISALYDDLNPADAGQISWKQLEDRVAVTYRDVPEFSAGSTNTFQIEMYFDGAIQLSYLAIAAGDGIVGLSRGDGFPPEFFETDLSTAGTCGPNAPAEPAPPHNARKNRYISVDPNNTLESVAAQVELVSMKRCSQDLARSCRTDADCADPAPDDGPCVEHPSVGYTGWVSEPFDPTCQTGPGAPPDGACRRANYVSRIVDTPAFRTWTENPVHIGDCAVIPVATYMVRVTTDGITFTDPVVIGTILKPDVKHYGDTVGMSTGDSFTPPQGVVNVTDVQAFMFVVQHLRYAPHMTWVDLHGIGDGTPPNFLANVSDLQNVLFGFDGQRYTDSPQHLDPADCP